MQDTLNEIRQVIRSLPYASTEERILSLEFSLSNPALLRFPRMKEFALKEIEQAELEESLRF